MTSYTENPARRSSNIFERADYDPAKHAVITLDVLIEVLHRWIIDVYCQRPQGKARIATSPPTAGPRPLSPSRRHCPQAQQTLT